MAVGFVAPLIIHRSDHLAAVLFDRNLTGQRDVSITCNVPAKRTFRTRLGHGTQSLLI
jgi:peptide deformylase